MGENKGRATAGTLEGSRSPSSSDRLDEERARQILERAAALDAARSSEIEIGHRREQKDLEQKAERVRLQLQRMLKPGE